MLAPENDPGCCWPRLLGGLDSLSCCWLGSLGDCCRYCDLASASQGRELGRRQARVPSRPGELDHAAKDHRLSLAPVTCHGLQAWTSLELPAGHQVDSADCLRLSVSSQVLPEAKDQSREARHLAILSRHQVKLHSHRGWEGLGSMKQTTTQEQICCRCLKNKDRTQYATPTGAPLHIGMVTVKRAPERVRKTKRPSVWTWR